MRNCSNWDVSIPNAACLNGQPIASGKANSMTSAMNISVAPAFPSARPRPETPGRASGRAASDNIELCATSL